MCARFGSSSPCCGVDEGGEDGACADLAGGCTREELGERGVLEHGGAEGEGCGVLQQLLQLGQWGPAASTDLCIQLA